MLLFLASKKKWQFSAISQHAGKMDLVKKLIQACVACTLQLEHDCPVSSTPHVSSNQELPFNGILKHSSGVQ